MTKCLRFTFIVVVIHTLVCHDFKLDTADLSSHATSGLCHQKLLSRMDSGVWTAKLVLVTVTACSSVLHLQVHLQVHLPVHLQV